MSDINWKDGAVCAADGLQFSAPVNGMYHVIDGLFSVELDCLNMPDFQLNEIRIGDYIDVSELDTEKYNDVIEVFGLFGFPRFGNYDYNKTMASMSTETSVIKVNNKSEVICNWSKGIRKLTYNQIMAIGKLKRMMLELEAVENQLEKRGEYGNNSEKQNSSDQVKNPQHYQIIDGVESIEIIARSMTREQFKGYCLGNTLKYRLRAGKKDALQQDIDKANFYGELYEMHKDKCYD